MDLGIAGHVAVVTGGARGIGAAICDVLAGEGCKVVVCDRDLDAAESQAATLRSRGSDTLAVQADVTRRDSVRSLADTVLRRYGSCQILVNNAGFSRDRAFLEMTDEDWDVIMDVCLKGVFLCSQAFAPGMIAQRYGRIVNIASRAHLGGEPLKTAYSAAKGGVVSFTKALSVEVGKHGVNVNAVAPGTTLTDRLLSLPHYGDIEARAKASVHTARLGTPRDMARAVAFLAAADSGFIAGETLYVTGGRYG